MKKKILYTLLALLIASMGSSAYAQTNTENGEEQNQAQPQAVAGAERRTLVNRTISFDATGSTIPPETTIEEILWNFDDGTRTTGEKVTHAYKKTGTYLVQLTIRTSEGISQDTTEIRVFDHIVILLADNSVSDEQLAFYQQQAAEEGILLRIFKARSGTEAIIEEDLTEQLVNGREDVAQANVIATWTNGSVGANVLSKFSQRIRQASEVSFSDLAMSTKGIVMLSTTPFRVLGPIALSTFDQLKPAYVLLSRPDTLPLLFTAETAQEVQEKIIASPVEHQLIGSFSSRALSRIGPTNFMSYGINYLINQGVPVNNIILILMIPVVATILAFARQVIGIKAFGLITPAMTTLAFLVLGLAPGLIVFIVVLLSGTLTRIALRRLRLLYLPRMGLVLTSASLAILLMLGIGAAGNTTAALSFSIFPILILIILAEEFIAVQFSRGAKTALQITAWTLGLSIACYYIVSWQLLRTVLLSYPETVLLAIPINIILGRFTGLRITEYIRFRKLLSAQQ